MSDHDEHGRPLPPLDGSETETLVGFLDYQRATLAYKTGGLDAPAMAVRIAASTLTLAGIVHHLAWVEQYWFAEVLHGRDRSPYWAGVDFTADPDWDWRRALEMDPSAVHAVWQRACDESRRALSEALTAGGLDQRAAGRPGGSDIPSLRWILVHMIEEYARHNGHADLLRETIDGSVGE
jgi:uncharacterized damage-inducible protein DinB